MNLSKRSVEMLLDLVEIKLSYMDISDREDARDLQVLERCKEELSSLERGVDNVASFARAAMRRAGPPAPPPRWPKHPLEGEPGTNPEIFRRRRESPCRPVRLSWRSLEPRPMPYYAFPKGMRWRLRKFIR